MKLNQSLKLLMMISIFILGQPALSETEKGTLVEVHIEEDIFAPYLERRPKNGMLIGLDYEKVILKNYTSPDDNATYDQVFGTEVLGLTKLTLDYKRNLGFGSLSIGLEYGTGKVDGLSDRSLSITKSGISARVLLDAMMSEPYLVPYFGFTGWQIESTDDGLITTTKKTTGIGYNYFVGTLLQLNWIDFITSKRAFIAYGLENTYLNLYASKYLKTGSPSDINTETDFFWGAGVKLEF